MVVLCKHESKLFLVVYQVHCFNGFLVPNVFCIPWRRLPESAALESEAVFQP